MNRKGKLLICILLLVFSATVAVAASGGNSKKGKYLYKKSCKSCHTAGAEGGEVTPLAKTQKQWDLFFEKNKHKAKPAVWKDYSDQDIKDIQQFLYDHAVDSDQPQTCG
jgi:mono/diheme cytochrome c family protein